MLETVDADKRNVEFLTCLLFNISRIDITKTSALLEDAFAKPTLKPYYPFLQSRVPADAMGVQRLLDILTDESIPVDRFRSVGYATGGISDDQLATLLPSIASRPGGFTIALDCAWIRMALAGKNDQPLPSAALVSAARSILVEHKFDRANGFEYWAGGCGSSHLGKPPSGGLSRFWDWIS